MKKQEEGSIKVAFGLEAQGHIPVIEAELERWNDFPDSRGEMTYVKEVWQSIAKKIGWDPFSAALAYLKWKRKKDTPKWVTLDWNNPATWPEEQRKVWVVSDRVKYEDELICYRDGDFYRNTEDWPIEKELEAGLKWCYVQRPPKPE